MKKRVHNRDRKKEREKERKKERKRERKKEREKERKRMIHTHRSRKREKKGIDGMRKKYEQGGRDGGIGVLEMKHILRVSSYS